MPLDLCDPMSFMTLREKLAADQPEVSLLVNNAGCGYLGRIGEADTSTQTRMVDLNVRALTAVTNLVVPYMGPGGRILNVSSIAAFCPTPRMTVYSAGKAYVSAYTVGAAEELREKGITVTAVCPAPMKTEFLDVGNIAGNSRMFERRPTATRSKWSAALCGRPGRAGRSTRPGCFIRCTGPWPRSPRSS